MSVSPAAARLNDAIAAESPALVALLSELGRQTAFPKGIPAQAGEAKGADINGTIGQITDGAGSPLPLGTLADSLKGLPEGLMGKAFLYSPIGGLNEVRHAWRKWQRRHVAESISSTLPEATLGLTHALSILADLFAGPGRVVAIPTPFWGNYRHIFAFRTGAEVVEAPFYRGGAYNPTAIEEALKDVPQGTPAIAILNLPSNPGGYSPTTSEREALRKSLISAAERRPLLVICDDAYAGLVYGAGIESGSMFWELQGLHPNLVPVKVDGITKELSFFGGRVGFLTFPFKEDSPAAKALESKVMHLVRATVGSPVAATQALVAYALGEGIEPQVEAVRQELGRRWTTLTEALKGVDRGLIEPLPFNSGCFALLKLGARVKVSAEEARLHILAKQSVGLVSIGDAYLRVAYCSVAEEALPELVKRVEAGLRELAG